MGMDIDLNVFVMSLPFIPYFFSSSLSNNFFEKDLREFDILKTITWQYLSIQDATYRGSSHENSEKGTLRDGRSKYICTNSTAQGGGGSFKDRQLYDRWVVVVHGWQSGRAYPLMNWEAVGVVLFGVVAEVTSPTTAECSVVWCGVVCTLCSCIVVAVAVFVV